MSGKLTSIYSTILIRKLIYLGIIGFTLICLSYTLSSQTPFSGDEFYTLDIEKVHKPVPYYLLVSNVINGIGQIKPNHTLKDLYLKNHLELNWKDDKLW